MGFKFFSIVVHQNPEYGFSICILIFLDIKCRVRIFSEINADPKHWFCLVANSQKAEFYL
jgi:hypothetical protein